MAGDCGYLVGLFATSYMTTVSPPSGMTKRVGVSQLSAAEPLTSEVATQRVCARNTGDRVATANDAADNIGQLLLLKAR